MKKIIYLVALIFAFLNTTIWADEDLFQVEGETVEYYRDIVISTENKIVPQNEISQSQLQNELELVDNDTIMAYVYILIETFPEFLSDLVFQPEINLYETPNPLRYVRSAEEFVIQTTPIALLSDMDTENILDQNVGIPGTYNQFGVAEENGGWEAPFEVPVLIDLGFSEEYSFNGDLDSQTDVDITQDQENEEQYVENAEDIDIDELFNRIAEIAGVTPEQAEIMVTQHQLELPIYYKVYRNDDNIITKIQAFDALGTCYVLLLQENERVYKRLEYHYYPPKLDKLVLFVNEYYNNEGELTERVLMDPDSHRVTRVEHYNHHNLHPNLGYVDILTYSLVGRGFSMVSYDYEGNKVKEAEYDDNHNQLFYIQYIHDEEGEGYTSRYYNEEDELISVRFYDENDVLLRDEIYGEYEEMIGYKEYEYNANGTLIRETEYNQSGNLILEIEYDRNGNLDRITRYGSDGEEETIDY